MASRPAKSRDEWDVIVIGGGFAGLIAARELASEGRAVIVLEARDRLGGRTWVKKGALQGLSLEMGGTWIDPRQRHVWQEAARYHVPLGEPIYGAPPDVWLLRGERRAGTLPVPTEEIPDVERLIVALNREASRIDPEIPLCQQDVADLDVSLEAFLDNCSLGPYAREAASVYLRAYASAYGENISALHLLRRLASAGSFSEFVMSGASYPLREGTSSLLNAIASEVGEIRLSAPVDRIQQDSEGVVARTSAGDFDGKLVVLAVPASVLKRIDVDPPLSPEKQGLSTEELACVGLKVWALAKHIPDDFSACGSGPGLDMLWAERSMPNGNTLVVGYGPDADHLDVRDLDAVTRAVRAFAPDAEVLDITGHDWRHDEFSLETWPVFRPGQITRYEQHLRALEGRIIPAGSYTALRWPGFIDGAIESGFRAAAEADALLKDERLLREVRA